MINSSMFAGSYHSFPFWGIGFGILSILFFLVFLAISIILKGYALWHSVKRDEKGWFIALLVINTMGVLELVYLYFIVGKWRKSKTTEEHIKEEKTEENKETETVDPNEPR